jgi:hypothetical protein
MDEYVDWMRDQGMPFLLKLSQQNAWTVSRRVSVFKKPSRVVITAAINPEVVVDIRMRESDHTLLRLRLQHGRFVSSRVKKRPYPIGKSHAAVHKWLSKKIVQP